MGRDRMKEVGKKRRGKGENREGERKGEGWKRGIGKKVRKRN